MKGDVPQLASLLVLDLLPVNTVSKRVVRHALRLDTLIPDHQLVHALAEVHLYQLERLRQSIGVRIVRQVNFRQVLVVQIMFHLCVPIDADRQSLSFGEHDSQVQVLAISCDADYQLSNKRKCECAHE